MKCNTFCESSGKEVPLPALESGETVSERRESSDEPLLQELQALKERLKTLEDANSCPICQEQFDTEEARRCGISICGHQFCVKCLLDLLKDSKKSHCPSCRVSFQTNNIIYLFWNCPVLLFSTRAISSSYKKKPVIKSQQSEIFQILIFFIAGIKLINQKQVNSCWETDQLVVHLNFAKNACARNQEQIASQFCRLCMY